MSEKITIDIYLNRSQKEHLAHMCDIAMPCIQVEWLTVTNAAGGKKSIPVKEEWRFRGEYHGMLPVGVNGSAVFMVVHTSEGDFKSDAIYVCNKLIKEDIEITRRPDYIPKYDIEFMPAYPVKISQEVKAILMEDKT